MIIKNKLIQIALIAIFAFNFTACEDKKEFKDTLGIEKENKKKLPKPEWDTRLQNYDNTNIWFQEADENEIAASNIGVIYSNEIKDDNYAIKWYLYSDSIKNDADNLFYMALSYEDIRDYNNAIKYFKKSFELNRVDSATNLGNIYQDLKDYKNSEIWYKKGIEKKSISSLKNIGLLYHNDLKDNIKACAYYIALIDVKYSKERVLNVLKNKWKLSDETIKKGYELQLTMPGLPKRYTGGI